MTTGEQPKSVSRRWRIILILVSIVLMVLTLWIGADFAAEQQLAAQIARIRAAGEPVTEADLATNPPVPDEDNAALFYQRLKVLKIDIDWRLLDNSLFDPDFRRAHRADVLKIMEDNKETLDLLRQARSRSRCDFKVGLDELRYGPVKTQTKLLCLAAVHAHDSGDDAAAIEYLLDALALGRNLGASQGLVIAYLRVATDALALTALEEVLPTVKIGDSVGAARPEQLQSLQELLLDGEFAGQLRRSLLAERVWLLDFTLKATRERSLEFSGDSGTIRKMQKYLLPRLFWKRDVRLILEDYTQAITALGGADCAAIEAAWPKPRGITVLSSWCHPLYIGAGVMSARLSQIHVTSLALRRMAGAAVAMRRYEVAKGRRPEKLEDLVPEFLKEVPKDPWSGAGRMISWTKAAPARLYCVGLNGSDDGGAFTEQGTGVDSPDQVFFLDADRPFAKATPPPDPASAPFGDPLLGGEMGK